MLDLSQKVSNYARIMLRLCQENQAIYMPDHVVNIPELQMSSN